MPMYSYECPNHHKFSFLMTFSDREKADSAGGIPCKKCDSLCVGIFDPGDVGGILKDGESGSWSSKALKEKAYRSRRWDHLGQKNKDHVRPHDLVPNYEGQVHDRWSDIQDHVRTTSGEEAASSYESYVKKEKVL